MDSMTVGGVSGGNGFTNFLGKCGVTLMNVGHLVLLVLLIVLVADPTVLNDKSVYALYGITIFVLLTTVVLGMIWSGKKWSHEHHSQ